jgi:hypothetical protein
MNDERHKRTTRRPVRRDRSGKERRRSQEGMAIAKLSQQIISTAKVEMEYHKLKQKALEKGDAMEMGSMPLGQRAVSAEATAPQIEAKPQQDVARAA